MRITGTLMRASVSALNPVVSSKSSLSVLAPIATRARLELMRSISASPSAARDVNAACGRAPSRRVAESRMNPSPTFTFFAPGGTRNGVMTQ